MSSAIEFRKADGTALVDMSVPIVGQWRKYALGTPVSFQLAWDGNVTGTWSIEGTNKANPEITETRYDTYPSTSYAGTPSQPAGAAGSTTILIYTTNEWHRPKFTPSAGGSGVNPSGDIAGGGF